MSKRKQYRHENSLKVALQCCFILGLSFCFIVVYLIFLSDNIMSIPEEDIDMAMVPQNRIVAEEVKYPKEQEREDPQPPVEQPKKDDLADIADISLDIRTITIDVGGYTDRAEFLWVSDLHMVQNDSASGRYADILGHEYDSAAILKAAMLYANDNSLPMIMGADIVDYASNANYDMYRRIMSHCNQTIAYIRADHDVATDLNNPDNLSSTDVSDLSGKLPGAVSLSYKTIDINGVNVVCVNMSTNKSGESAQTIDALSKGPTIICTHVPFPIGDTTTYIQSNPIAHDLGVARTSPYNWDYEGSQWDLDNNARMKAIYETSLNNENVSAVLCGHTHLKDEHSTTNDGLQQILLAPAFAGIVYHIILT